MKQISDNGYAWKQAVAVAGVFLAVWNFGGTLGRPLAHFLALVWCLANFRVWGSGTMRVFDLGDRLELCEGINRDTVSFENIDRVIYEKRPGTQWCILHLSQPCLFGNEVRFIVSQQWISPTHRVIADDLHRRSLCCKPADVG